MMGQNINSYQVSLLLHVLINKKERGETVAMIKDDTTLVGRGQTRGDAINSVLRRWLMTKDCDSLMKKGETYLHKFETKPWDDDRKMLINNDLKLLTINLGNHNFYIPAYWCEYFNFSKLDKMLASASSILLTDAIEKLGTKIDTIEGEVGSTCLMLKNLIDKNPYDDWRIR